jgi:hypothetical protein
MHQTINLLARFVLLSIEVMCSPETYDGIFNDVFISLKKRYTEDLYGQKRYHVVNSIGQTKNLYSSANS